MNVALHWSRNQVINLDLDPVKFDDPVNREPETRFQFWFGARYNVDNAVSQKSVSEAGFSDSRPTQATLALCHGYE